MKLLRYLDNYFEEFIMSILFAIMVSSIFLQVIMRKVFNDSLSWSEELARYCFIWLVYIGISYAVKKMRHIKIDLLYGQLNPKFQRILRFFSNTVFAMFSLFILVNGINLSIKFFELGQISPALHIPAGVIYLAAPVGLGFALIRLVQNMILDVRGNATDA